MSIFDVEVISLDKETPTPVIPNLPELGEPGTTWPDNTGAAYAEAMALIQRAHKAMATGAFYEGMQADLERAFAILEEARQKEWDRSRPPSSVSHDRMSMDARRRAAAKKGTNMSKQSEADFQSAIRSAYNLVEKAMLQAQASGKTTISKAADSALGDVYVTLRSCLADGLTPAQQRRAIRGLAERVVGDD